MSNTDKTIGIDKLVQAAIEIRTERNLLEDAVDGGEIQWAEAMTEPVNKLVVALNLYQRDDTFNDDTPAQTFSVLEKMREIICLKCGLGYQLYHNRLSIERDGMCRQCFDRANAGKKLVVPDVRFENEADLVREHGVLIHLVGRGGIEGNHASENPIEFKPGDIVIDNSRDLAWLYGQVDGNAALDNFVGDL